jgi:hypothetical protein
VNNPKTVILTCWERSGYSEFGRSENHEVKVVAGSLLRENLLSSGKAEHMFQYLIASAYQMLAAEEELEY